MPMNFPLTAFVTPAIVLMLSACTRVVVVDTPMQDLPTASIAAADASEDWWDVDFTMAWNREDPPDTFLDLLVADQVCAPALAAVGEQIRLWRFHRRYAPDAIGHRLRLRVYTDKASAERLLEHIRDSSVLQWLESDEWVDSVEMIRRDRPEDPPIARASDSSWPPAIQASWPWFIMGVSQTWLVLIKEVSAEHPFEDTSKWALLEHYRQVDEIIAEQWRMYGQHAYLHHLNALFAYRPVMIRGDYLISF